MIELIVITFLICLSAVVIVYRMTDRPAHPISETVTRDEYERLRSDLNSLLIDRGLRPIE